MHPDLELFLERAFEPVQPTSPEIGRVVVEPDYDANPEQQEAQRLADELVQCLREQSPEPTRLASHEGFAVEVPQQYPVLRKYIRSIALHQDKIEGAWVEVAPPGNWI